MSKKIASGANAIVLDVKVGLGAFMQYPAEARQLADLMVLIGETAGSKMKALLSDMNQPLGQAVGNVLEMQDTLNVLHGGVPGDFYKRCLNVSGHMLVIGGVF